MLISQSVESDGNANEQLISIRPNPTSDRIRVLFKTNGNNAIFKLYDGFGNLLFEFSERNLKDSYYELPIDLSNFASGIYYLQFSIDGRFGVEKVILNK
jgi:hypothetical protein